MPRNALARRVVAFAERVLASPDDLVHEIQVTLAALADIECSYEAARERLDQCDGSEDVQQRLSAELEERRRRECQPHLRRLDELEHRLKAHLRSSG